MTKFSAKEILEIHERQKRENTHSVFEFHNHKSKEDAAKYKRRSSFKVIPEEPEKRSPISSYSDINDPQCIEMKYECMVVGFPKVGKHFLINSCFEEPHLDHQKDYIFDMMEKSVSSPELVKSYHFWIHQVCKTSFDNLIKTYYKKVKLFIFIFDVANLESFQILEESANKIRKEVPGEKFRAILIGNHTDPKSSRKISHEAAEEFKIKHNFLEFLEVKFESNQDLKGLLLRLDQYLAI